MRRELDCAVAIFTDQAVTDATAFDWSRIRPAAGRRELRSVMVDRDGSAGTVNHMLSGVRSTVHTAWELGLVDDKTRIAVENEPNEKPQQRRRRRTIRQTGQGSAVVRGAGYRSYRRPRCSHARFALRRRPSALGSSCALQLADYDQVSGAITVRHDERQVYATNGGKEAIDAWIASRGDWPGALLCPVAKGGRIQPRDMTARAVMVRVRTIAEQAGVGPVTPNDLRLTYLTELERQRLDARTQGKPEGLPAPVMLSLPYQAPQFDDQTGDG